MNLIPLDKIQSKFSVKSWNIFWGLLALVCFAVFAHRAWFIEATDFVAYYNAGTRILGSSPLYVSDEPTPYKYLPFSAYFFVPFSLLPFKLAKMLFFSVSFLASLLVYKRTIKYYGNVIAALLFVSLIRFHNYDFLNSQINQILLWLLMNFLWDRNKKPLHSAISLAVLSTFKVTPLLLLLPLILFKKFKEALCILGIFLLLCLLPLIHMSGGIQIYNTWLEHMRATTPFPVPDWDILQSLPVALWYWLGALFTPEVFKILNLSVSVLLIGSASYATLRYTRSLRQYPSRMILVENALLSGFFVLTIILSPLGWKHNYLLTFPAILSLILFSQSWAFGLQLIFLTLIPATLGNLFPEFVHRSYIMIWGSLILLGSIFQVPWFNFRQKVQVWLFSRNKEVEFLTLQTNARRGGFWQPVTGSVELGEDAVQAAIREVREETNFNVKNSLKSAESEFAFRRDPFHFYEFTFYSEIESSQQSQIQIDPKEHSQFKWLTFSKALSNIKFESNKNILKKIFILIQRH